MVISQTRKMCPFCQTTVQSDAAATVCAACGIPHHQECWHANGGCTTYGCPGQAADETQVILPRATTAAPEPPAHGRRAPARRFVPIPATIWAMIFGASAGLLLGMQTGWVGMILGVLLGLTLGFALAEVVVYIALLGVPTAIGAGIGSCGGEWGITLGGLIGLGIGVWLVTRLPGTQQDNNDSEPAFSSRYRSGGKGQ